MQPASRYSTHDGQRHRSRPLQERKGTACPRRTGSSIWPTREKIEAWRRDDNQVRSQSALGYPHERSLLR